MFDVVEYPVLEVPVFAVLYVPLLLVADEDDGVDVDGLLDELELLLPVVLPVLLDVEELLLLLDEELFEELLLLEPPLPPFNE